MSGKNIFIGGYGACSVPNEKYMINFFARMNNWAVSSYQEADLIVIVDTCVCTYASIHESIEYIAKVLEVKKDEARVIVSGCLTKKMEIVFSSEAQKILGQVEMISQDDIIEYVCRILGSDKDEIEQSIFGGLPYSAFPGGIKFAPNIGCLNHCSYCKTNYLDFPLRSIPIEKICSMANDIEYLERLGHPIHFINLCSSNLSLYGVDLYGESRTHELLNILSKPDSVKFINTSTLINWNQKLLDEILNNPKVKSIFIALESGSERVYNLMNRPIGLLELKSIILEISRSRPDIIIETEFICGFPTETDEEFMKTIELVLELDIRPLYFHPYVDSPGIKSSELKQYPYRVGAERRDEALKLLTPQMNKYSKRIDDSELVVLDVDEIFSSYRVLRIDGSIEYIDMAYVGYGFKKGDLIPVNKGNNERVFRKCKSNC